VRGGHKSGRIPARAAWALLVGAACLAPPALADPTTGTVKEPASATLQQCITTGPQGERAATFAGEMQYLPGSAKMQMRFDVLERLPQETLFHTVVAPGLGVWRSADPGVKNYKHLELVTNLAAPASYRAAIRFRWLNAKGRLIRTLELRTPRCFQPALPKESVTGGGEPAPTAP
jgi:hypothetical protein